MFLPVLLLGASVGGWVVMISMAVDDPGFSVESDYYKKAANYDDVIARRAENERLGLSLKIASFAWTDAGKAALSLTLVDRDGMPAADYAVVASAFPIARGNDLREVRFQAKAAGVYEALLDNPRRGLWEIRVTATKGADAFVQPLRAELLTHAPDPS